MVEIRNPRLRGRRLEPTEWRVREAISPVLSGSGWRFWALLLCDEGVAAFEWPRAKYWRVMLRIGIRAGLAHQPSTIDGDSWPLTEHASVVESPSAVLFAKSDTAAIEIRRRRWLTTELRIRQQDGKKRWIFTIADPRNVDRYAAQLHRFVPISRTGWWPDTG